MRKTLLCVTAVALALCVHVSVSPPSPDESAAWREIAALQPAALTLPVGARINFGMPAAYAGATSTNESQALTRAVPSASSEGVSLNKAQSFRLSVCATSGNTLSGAGTLQIYLYNPSAGLWMRNPSLDAPITVTSTSCQGAACRCQVFPDYAVPLAISAASTPFRVLAATSGVTVSGGTTVDVRIEVYGAAL